MRVIHIKLYSKKFYFFTFFFLRSRIYSSPFRGCRSSLYREDPGPSCDVGILTRLLRMWDRIPQYQLDTIVHKNPHYTSNKDTLYLKPAALDARTHVVQTLHNICTSTAARDAVSEVCVLERLCGE